MDNSSVALLIDWENIKYSAKQALNSLPDIIVLKKIARRYGSLAVSKAYANWLDYQHEGDMERFSYQDVEPVFVQTRRFIKGRGDQKKETIKGSADIKLACDCIELLCQNKTLSTFILASGDGGFEHIIGKIKAYGKRAVVIGFRETLGKKMGVVTEELVFYEDWVVSLRSANISQDAERILTDFSRSAEDVRKYNTNNTLQIIKQEMLKKNPDFNEENHGFPTFRHLAYVAEKQKRVRIDSTAEPGRVYRQDETHSDEGVKLHPSIKWEKFIQSLEPNLTYAKRTLNGIIKDKEIYKENNSVNQLINCAVKSNILRTNIERFYDAKLGQERSSAKFALNLNHPRVQVYSLK